MPSEPVGAPRSGRIVTAIVVTAAVVAAVAAVLVFFIPTAGQSDADEAVTSAPNSPGPTALGASPPSRTPTAAAGTESDNPAGDAEIAGEPHLESIQLFIGDTHLGNGNVYYPSLRRMDFRFWWIAYSETGPLQEGCTVSWRIERLDGSLVEKASYPRCDFSNGFARVTLPEGAYSLAATATRDGYSATDNIEFAIRPQ